MKKLLIIIGVLSCLLAGCGKAEIINTYTVSEEDGILQTYYELNNGTWKCNDTIYQYRLELSSNDASLCYVVLTDNENLTFEDVAKSLFSSSFEVSKKMESSAIVEMK